MTRPISENLTRPSYISTCSIANLMPRINSVIGMVVNMSFHLIILRFIEDLGFLVLDYGFIISQIKSGDVETRCIGSLHPLILCFQITDTHLPAHQLTENFPTVGG